MEILRNLLVSFIVGGIICAIGQIILDSTKFTIGRILTMFVLIGVVLGALGIYEKIADFALCGASIPLTGFGYAMVKGTQEAILEKGAIGILTGPLSSSSAGVTTAVICGLIASFITKPKEK